MASIWYSYFVIILAIGTNAQFQGSSYTEPQQQYQQQQFREPPQYAGQDPRRPLPAIIMHKQALSHDGAFNYAFAADNGLQQGETINPDGSRTGSYSYVDPAGKTIKVKYSAGKDGFRVLEGDHVPREPQAADPAPAQGPSSVSAPSPYSSQHAGSRYSAQPQFRQSPGAFPVNNGYVPPNLGTAKIFGGPSPQARPSPVYQVKEDHEPTLFRASAPSYQPSPRPRPAATHQINEEYAENESKEPHSFGGGYSFEFSG